MENIHPIFDQILKRADKEQLLRQKGIALWMTGLSGSGKSTIAKGLEQRLFQEGYLTKLLDGDNVRSGLCNNLGFSDDERRENIRRVAEVSRLFVECGVITINSFISPSLAIRQMAKDIIQEADFYEIFVNCPLEVCEQRDVKGLYKKARDGDIQDFTGIHSEFEKPESPFLEIRTDQKSVAESIEALFEGILPYIKGGKKQS